MLFLGRYVAEFLIFAFGLLPGRLDSPSREHHTIVSHSQESEAIKHCTRQLLSMTGQDPPRLAAPYHHTAHAPSSHPLGFLTPHAFGRVGIWLLVRRLNFRCNDRRKPLIPSCRWMRRVCTAATTVARQSHHAHKSSVPQTYYQTVAEKWTSSSHQQQQELNGREARARDHLGHERDQETWPSGGEKLRHVGRQKLQPEGTRLPCHGIASRQDIPVQNNDNNPCRACNNTM